MWRTFPPEFPPEGFADNFLKVDAPVYCLSEQRIGRLMSADLSLKIFAYVQFEGVTLGGQNLTGLYSVRSLLFWV